MYITDTFRPRLGLGLPVFEPYAVYLSLLEMEGFAYLIKLLSRMESKKKLFEGQELEASIWMTNEKLRESTSGMIICCIAVTRETKGIYTHRSGNLSNSMFSCSDQGMSK